MSSEKVSILFEKTCSLFDSNYRGGRSMVQAHDTVKLFRYHLQKKSGRYLAIPGQIELPFTPIKIPENPKKDQKYPMLRENLNKTSKRRNCFENHVVPSRRPFSEKKIAEKQTAVPSRGPLSVPSNAPPCSFYRFSL